MKNKVTYTNVLVDDVEVVADFLPSPAHLEFRETDVRVTLTLSKSSVEFFKAEASKHQTQYQRMIRRFLDSYVEAQGAVTREPHSRAMPVISKERVALFSGIETSAQFATEAVYAAFGSPSQTK